MAYVALALQLVFLGAAFGLRTLLHMRRTGSTGFRAGAGRSLAEAIGAGGITIAALLSVVAVVLHMLDLIETLDPLDSVAVNSVGVALALAGIALVLKAQSDMGASWRIGVDPDERTELVTQGLFRWTRNPIFLGMLVFWVGTALLAPNVLSLAAVLLAFIAIEVQIRLVEEPYLIRTQGEAYLRYAAATGRLLPGIGKLNH